jgi:long-chain acyl-CoA synthetase
MSGPEPEFPSFYCFPMGAELNEGDRVALLVPPSEAYLDVVIGLLAAGVVPIPLDPRLTAYERRRILSGLSPTLEVTDRATLEQLRTAYPDARGLPRARPMHCTSGTTGTPKGVWSGILADEDAAALVAEERSLWGFTDGDVNLVLSPLYHSAPLRFAMGTALAGGRVVLPGPFSPELVTDAIERERPTSMFCVPTHLQRLFAHWDAVGTPDLSSFRLVAHAGAPCPDAVKRRLVATFPEGSTREFYGSTEGQFTACRSEEWLERPGTVGRARPGRVLSTDDDGQIWCAVPAFARFSYFGDPEKTAAAWRDTPDGPAFTVGDLGRLDDDGYLFLDGRREDLVISGGVNVYPLEVEQALLEHPGVEDVAVYGVLDDEWGQRVCAAYVGPASAEELDTFVRERLAPPKRPKSWHRLPDLPRTLTGKVLRHELPDSPAAGLGGTGRLRPGRVGPGRVRPGRVRPGRVE